MTEPAESVRTAPDPLAPAKLGPIRLRNRVIKAATYEHMARRGKVTDALIDFHVRHAAGGVAMTTVAYCAVAPEGRTDGHQILWTQESAPGLRRLTDAVHAEGAAISAQVGHSGPVGDRWTTGAQAIAPSRYFNKQGMAFARRARKADIDRIVAAHGQAVRMAIDAGFDAVEVHLGHNYLASSFLSPRLNRRRDDYGGSLENRARLAREIMRSVRDAAGDRIAVLAKLNLDDGVPGGFWIDESVQVAQWLEQDGTVDALELTAGSSLMNPMYLFRGTAPIAEFAAAMPPAIRPAVRVVGRRLLKEYPYRDGFLLDDARQVRAAVRMPLVLLGGVTSTAVMDQAMQDGFEFVAMARALLREPDLVNRMTADRRVRSLCNHNNRCMATTFQKTRCVLVPADDSTAPPGERENPTVQLSALRP
jgi:2,4-dienoyl-CoA reductase-like NADH-dependent reductase (Old Yellow Enzyme family)